MSKQLCEIFSCEHKLALWKTWWGQRENSCSGNNLFWLYVQLLPIRDATLSGGTLQIHQFKDAAVRDIQKWNIICQIQVWRPGGDYLVESAADPAAWDDPRGFEHPEPGGIWLKQQRKIWRGKISGDEHEHPPRAGGRPQRPPWLPRQVILCHWEAAAAGMWQIKPAKLLDKTCLTKLR